jgi:hypothetical protein
MLAWETERAKQISEQDYPNSHNLRVDSLRSKLMQRLLIVAQLECLTQFGNLEKSHMTKISDSHYFPETL